MDRKLLVEWVVLGFNRMSEWLLWAVAAGNSNLPSLQGRGQLKNWLLGKLS
jgi:hypothetical protein